MISGLKGRSLTRSGEVDPLSTPLQGKKSHIVECLFEETGFANLCSCLFFNIESSYVWEVRRSILGSARSITMPPWI